MSDFKSNRKLFWIAAVVMVACLGVTAFAVWYTLSSQDKFNRQFEDIKRQLNEYNLSDDTVTVKPDEAQYLLAVAKYCEANSMCRGRTGLQGEQGLQGIQGAMGLQGLQGVQGIKGDKGDTGEKGADGLPGVNGQNGRPVERQCNPEKQRMEWRLQGEENWIVEYNLAPGQSCVLEEQL